MAHVAAHDDIRSTGSSQRQILVIFRIATLLDGLGRFEPLRRNDHNIKDALATFDSNEAIKLRPEETSRYSSSTACERSNRFGALTPRSSACSGRLFALR